jgi:tetratricopeptide (TPR) repeat protein
MKRRNKRKDFEIIFYENLIKLRPNFIQALSCLGDAYTRKGFYQEGLEVDRKLVKLRPEDPVVHYNLACSLSLLGDVEQSFQELKKAVLLGYDDFSYILEDPDLADLRKHPAFKEFYQKLTRIKS